MASFLSIVNSGEKPTPFGVYDLDPHFQEDADGVVLYVKRMLGDDIMSVELTNRQIYACFEEATLEFSKQINSHQAESYMSNILGISTGSLENPSGEKVGPHGKEQLFPRETLEYLIRRAEPYATEAFIGGSHNAISGSIKLEQGRQDYNIYEELEIAGPSGTALSLKNSSDSTSIFNPTNFINGKPILSHATKTKVRIQEVFHFSPQAAYRFFDTTSAINYLNNQFAFESFTPETVFYVLPVFEDLLRAQQLDISNRVRRSNYSYLVQGQNIRIYPRPTSENPQRLFIKIGFPADPFSANLPYDDQTINGVSNISNVPFGNIPYKNINSISRQWIKQYTLALSKETLGYVRSKFNTVPIPGSDVQMNGSDLLSHGRDDKDKLLTSIKETLDRLTYQKLLEADAAQSEQMLNILKRVPIPNGKVIIMG